MPATRSTDAPPLLVQRTDAVETIQINDPPLNRMSLSFIDTLETEIARIDSAIER